MRQLLWVFTHEKTDTKEVKIMKTNYKFYDGNAMRNLLNSKPIFMLPPHTKATTILVVFAVIFMFAYEVSFV